MSDAWPSNAPWPKFARRALRADAMGPLLAGTGEPVPVIDPLHVALARAGRRSTLAAVVFLDLDEFKQVNDTLGHQAGDELLVRVADRLRGTVRPADILGRWGGDGDRPEGPVFWAGVLPPKQEQLTTRLRALLSSVGNGDTPAGTDKGCGPGA